MIFSLHNNESTMNEMFKKLTFFCEINSLSYDVLCCLKIIADEIVSNIINYSDSIENNRKLIFSITKKNNDVRLKIIDFGQQFNPLLMDAPDTTSDLEERAVGGLGIYLVRQFSKEVRYQRKNDKNILTIILAVK